MRGRRKWASNLPVLLCYAEAHQQFLVAQRRRVNRLCNHRSPFRSTAVLSMPLRNTNLVELANVRVAILVEHDYEDLDLWYPYLRLQEGGAEVFIVGSGTAESYTSKRGARIMVDADADMVYADQFDGVIIPGGWAPDRLRRCAAVLRLVREADEEGKLIAALGHAGCVLVSANVLPGRTVTGNSAIRDDLINAGARYVDAEVVRDGNLLTARQLNDLPAFSRELITALRTAQPAERTPVGARS